MSGRPPAPAPGPYDPWGADMFTAAGSPRSKLANIFGMRTTEPGTPMAPSGFMQTRNGATMMSPRSAVPGLSLRAAAPPPYAPSPRGGSATPRAAATPRGGYGAYGGVAVPLQSPRAAATARSAMRASTSHGSRADHHAREAQERMLNAAQERMNKAQQREKMKKLMQSIANNRDEVPVSELLLTAELAKVGLSDEQKVLLFSTPYANKYASTWEPDSSRSKYGLECSPRSVKWRHFNEALRASKVQDAAEDYLSFYENKEAKAIADQKARDEEMKRLAASRAASSGVEQEAPRGISDDQLKMVHKIVKQRLSTQFSEIRTAFRAFDKDHSGNISASECTDALLSLNVGVPRKWIDHLVNVADYDRDGEINYAEFANILTADDITKVKNNNAGSGDGPIDVDAIAKAKDVYKPGLKKSEMQKAQQKVRDMLMERGGLTKMYRMIDEDKSGQCSRAEMRQLIMNLNLESIIRPAVLEELIHLMDVDHDDQISYKEFARVVTAEDVFDMTAIKEVVKEEPKKMTKKQKRLQEKRNLGLI